MSNIERRMPLPEPVAGRLRPIGRGKVETLGLPSVPMALDVRPVTGTIGAEVLGVDPSQPLDDGTVDEIRKAWLDHLVLFFRNVDVTPAADAGKLDDPEHRSHGWFGREGAVVVPRVGAVAL